jgi:predicted N-acetyltransferase YhbS
MAPDGPRVTVRPASRKDIPSIAHVSDSSVTEEEVAGFGPPGSIGPFSDAAKLSAEWRDPNTVGGEDIFVAELDGRVVGYVTVEDRGEALELINIDVPRALQGRGIGTQMVRFVEEFARQVGKGAVTLGTSRNAAGVPWKSFPWWQRRGFVVTGEEENAWTRSIGPGVREIRMRKQLY